MTGQLVVLVSSTDVGFGIGVVLASVGALVIGLAQGLRADARDRKADR